MPLLECSEIAVRPPILWKQLYSGDGNSDGEEADDARFISLGENDRRATFPISPKTLPGETYAESL